MSSYREYRANRAVTMRATIMRMKTMAMSVSAAPQARSWAPANG